MNRLDKDPGATVNTAFNFEDIDNISFTDSLTDNDETDLYRFSLNQTSEVSILLETNSLYVISLDFFIDKNNNGNVNNGESILPFTNYANLGGDSSIKATLGAGDYSVRLHRYFFDDDDRVNYSLSLDATPALSSLGQDPGNDLSTAFNLGHLNGNLDSEEITEFIGNTDSKDFYRFSIAEGEINLSLKDLTGKELGGTIDVELIKDKNYNNVIDDNEILRTQETEFYSWDDTIYNLFGGQNYDSGNYFLRFGVSEYDDHTNTNYSFELSSLSENSLNEEDTAIYRFFRPDNGSHFYTASSKERDYVSKNLPQYQYEGISYTTPSEEESLTGMQPVYRFFNSSTGVHLYTMSEKEKEHIIDNLANYNFENVAYYAYKTPQENTVPLYRFYHTIADTHFFTPSAQERDYIKENLPWYQQEGDRGIAFYVEPVDNI